MDGMAMVYKAKDTLLNRYVAVKVLRDEFTTDSEFIKKFRSEAQSAASLAHPNIVQIFDVGNEDNLYFIVMELINGKTLKEIIDEDGPLSWKWSVNIAIQICSALETAHKNSIVHRDIKPHNIIITEEGIAKVTDFGIAKAVSNSTITAFGTTIGSVHYFSPEHARGGYTDAKSDIYSLGIVMYEMLTNRVPFDADTPVSVALKQVQEDPIEPIEYNEKIPVSVNRIILKAMQKDPNDRYQNATEMLDDLSRALKMPDEDFVKIATKDLNSPTQKIPTISEMEMERRNERKAPKLKEGETNEKKSKIREFYDNHKLAKPITFIVVAIMVFLIAMYSTMAILNGSRPKQEVMPNVAGYNGEKNMSKDDAVKLLNELGFKNISFEEEYSEDIEPGYVIKQSPEYVNNFKINVTEPVKLTISKGQKYVTLPKKMVGQKLEDIADQLKELEVTYEILEETSEEEEAGTILKVEPEQGEEISAATVVQITVSKGSQYKDVLVPSVIGASESDARNSLAGLNLQINVSYEQDESKSDGVVTTQNPAAGSTIKEGQTVNVIVNRHPAKSRVTINVNVQSLLNYTVPQVQKKDASGNLIYKDSAGNETTESADEDGKAYEKVMVPGEPENCRVQIKVGSDQILDSTYKKTETGISKAWTSSGVKEVKVIIDGTTYYNTSIDFSKGDQTVNVK